MRFLQKITKKVYDYMKIHPKVKHVTHIIIVDIH